MFLTSEVQIIKVPSDDDMMARPRRDFHVSLFPTIDLLEKTAFEILQKEQAKVNRGYLNCIGKRG